MINKKEIITFEIDVTRRCNLNCAWCCKGNAQDKDITKEIIDKSLEEAQKFAIHRLRIMGGEPCLVPDLVEYLVDQVIDRKLLIATADLFTNATICDERIAHALNRLGGYLKNASLEAQKSFIHTPIMPHSPEKVKPGSNVVLVLSSNFHANKHSFDECSRFYEALANEYVGIFCEKTDETRAEISLSGKAIKNFSALVGDNGIVNLGQVRIPDHKFMISDGEEAIITTISVSTNGNVYIGNSEDYAQIDSNPLFNIMGCKGDFHKRLMDYCWKYPIWDKMHLFREHVQTIHFCRENGYDAVNTNGDKITDEDLARLDAYYELSEVHEQFAKEAHKYCEQMNHAEVELVATFNTLLYAHNNPKYPSTYAFKWGYVECCTLLKENGLLGDLTPEWCEHMANATFWAAEQRFKQEGIPYAVHGKRNNRRRKR